MSKAVVVPLRVEYNRPFVDLVLSGPDFDERSGCAWVDTGGGSFIVAEAFASELGLRWGEATEQEGARFALVSSDLTAFLTPGAGRRRALHLDEQRVVVQLGEAVISRGFPAVAFLPAHVLLGSDVLFDYPGCRFGIGDEGSLTREGTVVPCPRHPRTGWPRVELEIDGERLGFLVDTGASYSMVSIDILQKWTDKHPDWPTAMNAAGFACMGHAVDLAPMVRVPQIGLGGLQLGPAGFVARKGGVFEEWMSSGMTAPIVGALAGNVLRNLRWLFSGNEAWVAAAPAIDPLTGDHDLDGVGLTLRTDGAGAYFVTGVCDAADPVTGNAVRAGDRLLVVDDLDVTGASFDTATTALSGRAGQRRRLTLERDGAPFTIEVVTAHLLCCGR